MKFTIEEFFEKLSLPANEKWKDGVWADGFSILGYQRRFFQLRLQFDVVG